MHQSEINKFEFIDALRGIAILGVIMVHSSQSLAPTNATLQWLMSEGARGVQLFYVVSALTLCMSWVARSSHEQFPIRNFYIRRFFRIAPMFYIVILTYIFVNGFAPSYWAPNGIQWWFVPITALFLHGLHPETINSVVPGGWSIAVEMCFYAILPFLLVHIKSIKACVIFLVICLGLYSINHYIVTHIFYYPENQKYLLESYSFVNFFGQLPVFAIGIIAYLTLREQFSRKKIAIVGGLAFFVFLLAFIYPVPNLPHHIIAAGLFAVLAILLANWPTRLLVNRVTTTIGKLSFSMYLTQFAILTYFARLGFRDIFPKSNIASVLYFLCVVLLVAVASYFFYKYVEKPGIALGKRLIEKLESDTAQKT